MNQDPLNISSIGHVAMELQIPMHKINSAAKALGFRPHMVVNGAPYFTADQVEALLAHIQAQAIKRPTPMMVQPGTPIY